MIEGFEFKEKYNANDLASVMSILRSPGGCPWDREQNHKTIRNNFIEEVYEAVEAIDTGDTELLKEELGDVLLQIIFHAQIESEKGSFSFDDVADGIVKKLIIRHPHVFGDVRVDNSADVLNNWDKIKRDTKNQKNHADSVRSVSPALPALMRSEKVQKRAAKAGFDWPDINGAVDKLYEEISELKEALERGLKKESEAELGDVLFSAVNVSRFMGVSAEESLTNACGKFIERFALAERFALERGLVMEKMSLSELDGLWDEAKRMLAAGERFT